MRNPLIPLLLIGLFGCPIAPVDSSDGGADLDAAVDDRHRGDANQDQPDTFASDTAVPLDASDAAVPPDASDAAVPPDASDAAVPLDASDAAVPLDASDATDDAGAEDAVVVDVGSEDAAVDAGPANEPGAACATAEDCGDGYFCDTRTPGGYCMPGSPGGPTACRDPEMPCPESTTCSPLPFSAISGVCLLTCTSHIDCRENYYCTHVELFPGDPDSPMSPDKVCWNACYFPMDQLCNDDPLISSLRGACTEDGICECLEGYTVNPETGRCH